MNVIPGPAPTLDQLREIAAKLQENCAKPNADGFYEFTFDPNDQNAVRAYAAIRGMVNAEIRRADLSKDDGDFLLGPACDLSGDGTCESCQ